MFAIKKYFAFLSSGKGKGNFKLPKDRKEIEDKIIEYIIFLKKKGMSYCGILIISFQ